MEGKRSYRRAVAENRVLILIVDHIHLLLRRLSDMLAGMNHLPTLDELLELCQRISPAQCNGIDKICTPIFLRRLY